MFLCVWDVSENSNFIHLFECKRTVVSAIAVFWCISASLGVIGNADTLRGVGGRREKGAYMCFWV
jgi:hypothetical protein